MKITHVSGTLVLLLTLTPSFAPAQQRLGDPTGGGSPDPSSPLFAQIQKEVPDQQQCSCGSRTEPAASFGSEFSIDGADGEISLFTPSRPRDALISMRNTGAGTIDVGLYDENSRRPRTISLAPGTARTVEMVSLVDITGKCLDSTGARCGLTLDVMHGEKHNGLSPFTDLWYPGPHVVGSAQVDPDSWTDCLWEYKEIWSSDTPRDLWLDVKNTGNTDVKVEVEYSNNTFGYYNTNGSTPANDPHRLIQTDEYQVVAIRVTCDKIPTYECGPCNYEYKITFEP